MARHISYTLGKTSTDSYCCIKEEKVKLIRKSGLFNLQSRYLMKYTEERMNVTFDYALLSMLQS